jgi:hypothetical protein
MTAAPTISVVIALHNKGPYIARALNSVLSQSFQDFEIIVVDDGSMDGGAIIARNIGDPRISLIQQENQGVSAARNKGIEATKAELIAFLDADDEWLPKHLEVLLMLSEKYPKAGAYSTAYLAKFIGEKACIEPVLEGIPREPWDGIIPNYFYCAVKSATLHGHGPISSSTVAIPKHILIEFKGFEKGIGWGEDTDLWGRIAMKYPIAFSWDGKGILHADALNRESDKIEPVKVQAFVISARKALQTGDVPNEFRDALLEYVAYKQIQTAARNLNAGRPDLARDNLKDCKTRDQWKSKYWTLFWTFFPPKIFIILKSFKSRKRR